MAQAFPVNVLHARTAFPRISSTTCGLCKDFATHALSPSRRWYPPVHGRPAERSRDCLRWAPLLVWLGRPYDDFGGPW